MRYVEIELKKCWLIEIKSWHNINIITNTITTNLNSSIPQQFQSWLNSFLQFILDSRKSQEIELFFQRQNNRGHLSRTFVHRHLGLVVFCLSEVLVCLFSMQVFLGLSFRGNSEIIKISEIFLLLLDYSIRGGGLRRIVLKWENKKVRH